MDADEREQRLTRLCDEALSRDAGDRAAFLDQACAGDPALRRDIESLLVGYAQVSALVPRRTFVVGAARLTSGTRLGPYEIQSFIGEGGMGQVYKGRDTRLGRTVAIKVLPPDSSASPDRRRRFKQEARAASALNDPHICALHDIGSDNGIDYLVMEYLDGETLAARLRRGPLPVDEALGYAMQITAALDKAHREGIVHRDVKPGNVFLTTGGHAKILDFGLAKLTEGPAPGQADANTTITAPGTVLGTIGYMSPEQVRGEPIDCRSDIFSFGAVFYEMLSGRRAFGGDSAADTVTAILTAQPPLLPSAIPHVLDRVTRRCLKKSAHERFQAAGDIGFALEALSPTAAAEEPGKATLPALRRHRLAVAGVFLLAVLAIVAGILAARSFAPPTAVPTFQAKTFDRLPVTSARFMPDGQRIVYSAAVHGMQPDLFMVSPNIEGPQALGISNAQLLSVSARGELALIVNARHLGQRVYGGTLARMTIGSSPRAVMEDVREADWSPDGASLAIVRDLGNGRDRLEYPIGTPLYEMSGYLSDPRVSPDGSRVAVFEHPWRFDDRGFVRIVDRERHSVTLGSEFWELEGLAWTPDGATVVFSASPSGGALLQPMSAPASARDVPQPVLGAPGRLIVEDVGRDGRWLAVREDLSPGVRGKVPSGSQERDMSWLGSSGARALSNDGQWMLMVDVAAGGKHYGVVLRRTDGSQTIRLGDGSAQRLSADGKWASAIITTPPQVLVYPTGTGERIQIAAGKMESYASAEWFPDAARLLVCGSEASRAPRCYVQPISGSAPEPLTPEGVLASVAPDGRTLLLTMPDGSARLSSTNGDAPRPVAGLRPDDRRIGWSGDSRAIYVQAGRSVPAIVERVDLSAGQRTRVGEILPEGLSAIARVEMIDWVDDGRWYVYNYASIPSTLFVVSGGLR